MVNFERLPKIFEMNDPKFTVPFDCELKIPIFFFQNGSHPGKFPNFRYFGKMENLEMLPKIFEMNVPEKISI